ncbi:MAG: cupredoxin domain-containing protein [Dehalococcoidia bacterium]
MGRWLGATLVAAVALVASCNSNDGPTEPIVDPLAGVAAEASLALDLRDIDFSEEVLTISVGTVVAIALDNRGRLVHDFTIQRIPADVSAAGQQRRGTFDVHVRLDGGDSARLLLRVTAPGEYAFFCSVAGHRQAGMEGMLTVTP